MKSPTITITDVWFRSDLPLHDIAAKLDLRDVTCDAENYWEWVIGTMVDARLDITRPHTHWETTYTRIFLLSEAERKAAFSNELIGELVSRLKRFINGPITCGRWEYRRGNEFDLVVIHEM